MPDFYSRYMTHINYYTLIPIHKLLSRRHTSACNVFQPARAIVQGPVSVSIIQVGIPFHLCVRAETICGDS